jgi:hypothetical protein
MEWLAEHGANPHEADTAPHVISDDEMKWRNELKSKDLVHARDTGSVYFTLLYHVYVCASTSHFTRY